jgi:hypothetical protein
MVFACSPRMTWGHGFVVIWVFAGFGSELVESWMEGFGQKGVLMIWYELVA